MKCAYIFPNNKPCGRQALAYSDYCSLHDYLDAPPALPPPDKYESYLPSDLRDRYLSRISSPTLISNRSEVALLDLRISQLVANIDSSETPQLWKKLSKLWKSFSSAFLMGDEQTQNSLFPSIDAIITKGATSAEEWHEISDIIDRRRRLTETESRQQAQARQLISVDQTIAMMQLVIESTRLVVDKYVEPELAKAIILEAAKTYEQFLGDSDGNSPVYAVVDQGS